MILIAVSFHLAVQNNKQVIRLAKLEIDATQQKAYNAVLRLEVETSVRIEPGYSY